VDGGKVVSYIGTDNKLGGKLAGEWMVDRINGKGKIAIIEGGAGSSTNVDRCEGFRSVIDQYPEIEVVASVPADWARDKGLKAMSDIIAGHPDLKAVMAMNDEMAIGAMEALKAAGASANVILCGYNGADEAIKYAYEGTMSATIVQFPEEMGKLYVENAIRVIEGLGTPADHLKPQVMAMDSVFIKKIINAIQKG